MSKIISIADDVYEKLTLLKGNSSFSNVIRSMMEEENSKQKVLSLFDSNLSFDKNSLKELKKGWDKWKKRYV